MTSDLVFYNTLTKSKVPFESLHPGKVGLYTCGPTVYDVIHIGNIRAYLFADTLRRVLENAGYEVRHIKNITDVGHLTADDIAQGDSGEDRITKKALSERKTPEEIANFYTDYFLETEEKLNILPAHFFPRATAHVMQMIKLIEELMANDHAYEVNGNVFYDVTSFSEYGKLSGNTLEKLKVGARLEEHPDKKNPWDFALWLKAPEGHLMRWTAPWSEGYPGWHIECSAMSMEYLGDTLDIHTGGEDNIFPHHEAEIAQSEGVTNKTFVNYWLHTRHLLIDGVKMSKSKGNFTTFEDIQEKGYGAMDVRMLMLSSHYRSQMNFTWDALEQAKKNKEKLFGIYARLLNQAEEVSRPVASEGLQFFLEALYDDLNTPLALSRALEFATIQNKLLDSKEPFDVQQALQDWQIIFQLFGLLYIPLNSEIPEEIQKLALLRQEARATKDFTQADTYRTEIEARGYSIKDVGESFEIQPLL